MKIENKVKMTIKYYETREEAEANRQIGERIYYKAGEKPGVDSGWYLVKTIIRDTDPSGNIFIY